MEGLIENVSYVIQFQGMAKSDLYKIEFLHVLTPALADSNSFLLAIPCVNVMGRVPG